MFVAFFVNPMVKGSAFTKSGEIITRPGVAGAVLQTPFSFIH